MKKLVFMSMPYYKVGHKGPYQPHSDKVIGCKIIVT